MGISFESVSDRRELAAGSTAARIPSAAQAALRRARLYLPRGDALPDKIWNQRHRAILVLLWLHSAALPLIGVTTSHEILHSLAEGGIVAVAALIASTSGYSRAVRMVAATFGLVTSSALLVHFSGGLIEMHFHFFVMVAVITLYQAWLPFLVALGYVVVHHGMMGAIDPMTVYNHPAAIASPWKWALVHGFFILGESSALLVVWRMNEDARADAERSYESRLSEEQARVEAQEKYREIFENAVEGIYEVSLATGETTVNPAVARMVGYSSVAELDEAGVDLGSFQVEPSRGIELMQLVETDGAVRGFEYEIRRKDGSRVWVSNNARAIRDSDGQLIGIQGTVEDITERKRSEAAIREREEQFRLLFESNPLPMWVYDAETLEFLAVNTAAVEHYGYSQDDFLEMRITDIRPDEDVPALLEEVGRERPSLQHSGPWRHLTADGRLLEVEIKSHTLEFRGRPAALVVVEDVTERNQAERQREKLEGQLRQAQKMEAVGQLAGGIAHDFNNILSVITNYASFLKEDMDPGDPRIEDLEEIRAAGDRGAKLVRQVLAFSRKEIVNPEVVDLNRAVVDMDKLLRRTLGEDVTLELKLEGELKPVELDRSHMEQVLLNLAVNARDAMKQGGKLVIKTANATIDTVAAEQHPELVPGEYVTVSVSDSGVGMNEELKARIFEPFFTTKPMGEGTGLGLAMVYGIVKQANGYIYVYSEPNVGTTFRIYFPVATAEIEAGDSRAGEPLNPGGGSETVLLVEDEPAVRELARRILERGGYTVVAAQGGHEAIGVYETVKDQIDLLLTDVIMPGMSGKELNDALYARGNSFKTLYMSGYTDEIIAERGLLHEGEELLQKPFSANCLLTKVREVLDK